MFDVRRVKWVAVAISRGFVQRASRFVRRVIGVISLCDWQDQAAYVSWNFVLRRSPRVRVAHHGWSGWVNIPRSALKSVQLTSKTRLTPVKHEDAAVYRGITMLCKLSVLGIGGIVWQFDHFWHLETCLHFNLSKCHRNANAHRSIDTVIFSWRYWHFEIR